MHRFEHATVVSVYDEQAEQKKRGQADCLSSKQLQIIPKRLLLETFLHHRELQFGLGQRLQNHRFG